MVTPRWRQLAPVIAALALALAPLAPIAARAQCYKLTGGCGLFPQQCFPGAGGPTSFFDGSTSQRRIAADSGGSTCHPPVTDRPPACCASAPPAGSQPTLSNLRASLVDTRGDTDTFEIAVDYDAPNFFCTNTGDWPPGYTCTNDPLGYSDHLVLYLGSATSPIDVLSRGFIYFESGTWTTNVPLHCGESKQVAAQIAYLTTAGSFSPAEAHTDSIEVVAPPCTDKLPCLACAGQPVNTGSGDVSVALPMFTLAQSPLALAFGLTYHSERPRYPALASLAVGPVGPVGLGWTHTYSQTLRPTDAVASSLYQRTGEGFDYEYVAQADGSWVAASPGELRGRVVAAGGRYQLTDLDGRTTVFDAASGAWLSTTDRWGNSLQGAYDGAGNLASVTDAEGRQIQLAYGAGRLAQITLPGGETWRLGYQGAVLTQVFDPLHTGNQPWRTFGYTADSQGVVRLLSEARDGAGFLLEGHAYDALDRGVTSVSEGGRNLVTLEYATPGAGQTRVTHAIDGVTRQVSVFTLTYGKGRYLPLEILGDCPTCSGATSDDQHLTYFPDNHVASRTDGNGHVTLFLYNGDGNVTSQTEAVGTAQQRTMAYRYDYAPWPNFRTEVDEPSAAKAGAQKVTTFTWNASGAPETVLTTAESGYLLAGDAAPTVYTTTRTFDGRHRLLATAGPRTDVTQVVTQTWFGDGDANAARRGRLQSVTDPSGNVTSFDGYDEFGTALTSVDANGVATVRRTDARGRVVASTSRGVAGVAGEANDYTTLVRVAFAGDATELPAATAVPVLVYQPASFVIWGGNTPGFALGQRINFWGSQWADQVTGGDYAANPSFKGFAIPAAAPVAICELAAHTSGSPLLDASCWTSKPGDSGPPSTLPAYIGVIVSTSIAMQGSSIYGNIAALVVLEVDPTSPYGSDPGHPGYGTVAAVIADGAGLFPGAGSRRAQAAATTGLQGSQDRAGEAIAPPVPGQSAVPAALAVGNRRFYFYSPELHLIAESELMAAASPAILNEYIWFGEHPVAQSDVTGTTSWTFTDHLGTPILQTSAAQGVTWRAEYEPYGAVYSLRSLDQHQPLRLPGQEAEQLSLGANGVTSHSYNINRWYESAAGRYSQSDPLKKFQLLPERVASSLADYAYVGDSPAMFVDPLGLCTECDACPSGHWSYNAAFSWGFALIGGLTVDYGTYTCRGREQVKAKVKIVCGMIGAIGFVGAGVATNPWTAACACNPKDFFGDPFLNASDGSYLTFGVFSLTQTSGCGGIVRTGGAGKSLGLGGAATRCLTMRR